MKATGIVRRIDELGRVVIPKEIRRTQRIRQGDALEIFTAADGQVVFKKYSPLVELGELAGVYAEVLAKNLGRPVLICDRESIVAATGTGKTVISALDYKLRKQMQNELKALQRKLGITFVFVTHDQEEALTMSDRIVVMRDGKIEQDGTPREIYEEPKNLFVASFIGEINIFNATVIERLDEQRVRANVEGRECNITVNFAVEKGQRLNVLLRPEDLRVDEIHDTADVEGLIGYVRERNYKGMTLESVVELENGKMVMVSEFFNEDDPDFDHSLDQKMVINWVESWEVVLADEEHK